MDLVSGKITELDINMMTLGLADRNLNYSFGGGTLGLLLIPLLFFNREATGFTLVRNLKPKKN